MLLKTITHAPVYVWLLVIYLIFYGYQSCYTRTRSVLKLIFIPAFFLWLNYSGLRDLFGLTFIHSLVSLLGLVFGFVLGVVVTRAKRVLADRSKWLIHLPGDMVTLTIILLNFPFQYVLHVAFYVCSVIPENIQVASLVLMGILTGISLGRNVTLIFKYFSAETAVLTPTSSILFA